MAKVITSLLIILLVCSTITLIHAVSPNPAFHQQSLASKCVHFNFGGGSSDTGSAAAAFGKHLKNGRYCDGRLYIDFIRESLNMTDLEPYLDSLGTSFRQGVNFACGVVMSFPTQVNQFAHFVKRTRELRPQGEGSLISDQEFVNAVYTIDVGDDYIFYAFQAQYFSNVSAVFDKEIPDAIIIIGDTLQKLYKNGARKFAVYNVGPFGCQPSMLAYGKNTSFWQLDEDGCMTVYNDASKAFNEGLSLMCTKMRSQLENATIVYIDMHSIKYDLIVNATKYGFESPLRACCGKGTPPYNYNIDITCDHPSATVCANPSRSVSWDGIHNTEAANALVAKKILSTNYSWPPIKFSDLCSLQI